MPGIRHFCDQSNILVDKHTLHFLRREVFAYTLIGAECETQRNFEIDLESPRVKNLQVKHYFSLAYFAMLYVQLSDEMAARQSRASGMTEHTSSYTSIPDKKVSPDFRTVEEEL